MLYKFKLCYNVVKVTKDICCANGEAAVDHSTISRWFKKFLSNCKNLNDQPRLDRPKIMDSEAVLQATETNLVSRTLRVSGKLNISQCSVVCHLHNFGKNIQSFCYQNKAKLLTCSSIHMCLKNILLKILLSLESRRTV